ncbi:MAG: methyl-accepting chemotaxis protein [Rhodocyclaceae bacterium]|nr:methyl-accepting chemotaxis protein [Rhodocyclaceae bacterium]
MKPSVLKTLLFASLVFGLTIGLIFPFFADFFVIWKEGMYGWFFGSAVMAGLTVGVANYWFVNRILISRLRRIAEVATHISERNLNHRCDMVSHDTVGEIITAFNKMAANLRDLIGEIGGMSGSVQQDTQNMQAQIHELRDRLCAQHNSSQQIAQGMNYLAGTVSDISATAEQAAESSHAAVFAAQSGAGIVAETIGGMSGIQHIVSQVSGDVNQLGQRSDEIGEIVAVIRGIAEQTNLLALNAAIEAARAGEQGRGFAVVADEVRKLAEKTGSATGEISQMISAIQHQVRQTVLNMEQSQDEVGAGVSRAEKAGAALAEILASIESVSGMMQHITTGTSNQRNRVNEICGQMAQIDNGIESALALTQVAEQSCERLSGHSATLHQQVGLFRLT